MQWSLSGKKYVNKLNYMMRCGLKTKCATKRCWKPDETSTTNKQIIAGT